MGLKARVSLTDATRLAAVKSLGGMFADVHQVESTLRWTADAPVIPGRGFIGGYNIFLGAPEPLTIALRADNKSEVRLVARGLEPNVYLHENDHTPRVHMPWRYRMQRVVVGFVLSSVLAVSPVAADRQNRMRTPLMADSLLCLLKDIGDRPDGRIENRAAVSVGIGKVELRQIVGLSKFDPAQRHAELFQITKICAPLLGCLDAGRQNITATVRASTPAWPSGMKAGDYGIANSYALEIGTDWSATKVAASLPPITIITPYGQVSAKPGFDYATTLLPIDTPFSYRRGSQVEFDYPGAMAVNTQTVQAPGNEKPRDIVGGVGSVRSRRHLKWSRCLFRPERLSPKRQRCQWRVEGDYQRM